ncbi:PucR family transcriptional regulator [Neobacillus citreus]|uniref:Helix-turn-helix domain-containing protein n=1 Tax=Neobacillus citreus TaxID=2833578 RepID=A0A942YBU0_9BACI|nr:helix-turn-helix domain-containing protein [Neobacillus citreus]MCH6267649.1 helix-turn-helix domain-containing protein [Neobacillus citreus]
MLIFQEIISSTPFDNAEILAGWKGKDRYILQAAAPTDLLEEPSLLLLSKSGDAHLLLADYLEHPNIQGILLYGAENIHLSPTILQMAETIGKPLLDVSVSNPYSLQKAITDLQQLKSMGLFHLVWERTTNYWLQLGQRSGLNGLLARLGSIIGEGIQMLNEHFYIRKWNGDADPEEQRKDLQASYYQQVKSRSDVLFMLNNGADEYLLMRLQSGEILYGFMFIQVRPGMMLDVTIEQLTHAIPAIISMLKSEKAVLRAHQSYKEQFLTNLLYNNIESEQTLINLGGQWGWDFTKPTQLMVLRMDVATNFTGGTIDQNEIISHIRSIVQANFLNLIAFPIQGFIVLIIFDSPAVTGINRKEFMVSLAGKIHHSLAHSFPGIDFQIGLGRQHPSNMECFRSFYEAKVALELGKYETKHRAVLHFEDIGIARLLANIHNDILHDYYQETLGKLIGMDQEEDFYLETIETFFTNNADINATAEQLYIHPNTLRKRIKKIESLLNVDFNLLDDLVKIDVALKIMKMLK